MTTLVVDAGSSIVGIFCVDDGTYRAYMGAEIPQGVSRIVEADEVVTYNGDRYDLEQIANLAGLPSGVSIQLSGRHTDMQPLCWGNIMGSSLRTTYRRHFGEDPPDFPDTYEGDNECDCHMTWRLWDRLVRQPRGR